MENLLSVSQVASLCGVGHSTVGYWIRANKLRAFRVGKQYSIPAEQLVVYLKSKGQEIPDELFRMHAPFPDIMDFTNCWQYFMGTADRHNCDHCLVFKKRVETCFTSRVNSSLKCATNCHNCTYYAETYLPKIQFIHRITSPAAVTKDFCLWGGNRLWAKLCGVSEGDLPGTGIEQIFHRNSLEIVIAGIKKWILGDPSVNKSCKAFFKNDEKGDMGIHISVYGLDDPPEALLLLAEPDHQIEL